MTEHESLHDLPPQPRTFELLEREQAEEAIEMGTEIIGIANGLVGSYGEKGTVVLTRSHPTYNDMLYMVIGEGRHTLPEVPVSIATEEVPLRVVAEYGTPGDSYGLQEIKSVAIEEVQQHPKGQGKIGIELFSLKAEGKQGVLRPDVQQLPPYPAIQQGALLMEKVLYGYLRSDLQKKPIPNFIFGK